jgi:hypothetical protein
MARRLGESGNRGGLSSIRSYRSSEYGHRGWNAEYEPRDQMGRFMPEHGSRGCGGRRSMRQEREERMERAEHMPRDEYGHFIGRYEEGGRIHGGYRTTRGYRRGPEEDWESGHIYGRGRSGWGGWGEEEDIRPYRQTLRNEPEHVRGYRSYRDVMPGEEDIYNRRFMRSRGAWGEESRHNMGRSEAGRIGGYHSHGEDAPEEDYYGRVRYHSEGGWGDHERGGHRHGMSRSEAGRIGGYHAHGEPAPGEREYGRSINRGGRTRGRNR